ncbi:MAG: YitT family protein, partial [Cloacibacillus sp.]
MGSIESKKELAGAMKWRHLFKRAQLVMLGEWKTLLISIAALFIYAIGVVGFTIPYKFADQGVMGIAVLLKYTLGFNPAWVTLVINIGLLAWGAKVLSKRFVIWTSINVVMLSVMLNLMQYIQFPHIDDIFLVAVTGGVIKGIGI